MNFGNSTIGKTYNLQNSVNLQQLLSLKELKNETVYYWENKAGLKYLGITPLTPQEAELSQEEQNHYFKDLGGFVMLAREFEEDTTRALFFRYALFQEKQHTRLITLEPDNDKNTPDLPLMETLFDNLQNPDNDGTTKNTGGAAPLPFKLIQSEERPTRQQWQARIIAALKELGDPENLKESLEPAGRSLKKVVFKRDISFTIENFSQGKIGAPLLFHHLCQKSTSAYKIFIKTKQ